LKALIVSDLHIGEYGRPFQTPPSDLQFDIVIFAGDVAGPLTQSLRWTQENFPSHPKIYVAGNHCFYRDVGLPGITIESELQAGRAMSEADPLLYFLEDDFIELGGVRIIGATLWSDMRSKFYHTLKHAMDAARRGMNDYKRIHRHSATRGSRRITPAETVARYWKSRRFIFDVLEKPFDGPSVVVTHHAPSLRSLPVQSDPLGHCYASDMDAQIEASGPDLWVHGHVHVPQRYRIGATKVFCNPVGRIDGATGYDPNAVIDLSN
jgi:predicted phosphodiesterase